MAGKPFKKINAKLQIFYRKNKSLNLKLGRFLWNYLIRPHFDYAFNSLFPLVSQKIRKKKKTGYSK